MTFKPGDTILFKAGSTFTATLNPHGSGTADQPITFGSYGTGSDPVFNGGKDVTHQSWSSSGGNVWSTSVPNEGQWGTENVWFNGKMGNIESSSASAVKAAGDWYYDTSAQKLYVYSASNPASAGTKIEANYLDYGLKIDGVSYIKVQDIVVQQSRYDVSVNNSTGTQLLNLDVHQSVRDGIVLSNSKNILIEGGESHDNGVNGSLKNMTHLGHGVLVADNTSGSTIKGMQLYNNTEDGVQFGPGAASNNHVVNNNIYGQGEDGIDIKGGSQFIEGNNIHGNTVNAILIHDYSQTITVTNNHLETVTKANALYSNAGTVVSSGNWYEGNWSQAVRLSTGISAGSSFTNDTFVNGGANGKQSVLVEDGGKTTFSHDTFVMTNKGYALTESGNANNVSVSDSVFYGNNGGDLINVASGKTINLSHNAYWDATGDSSWFNIGGATKGSSWASSVDGKAVLADPKFADMSHDNYTVGSSSAAAGMGSNSGNGGSTGGNTGGGTTGPNVINGTTGADTLTGTANADEIHAGVGNDVVHGGAGNDVIYGDAGNDTLYGDAGADKLTGGDGADTFVVTTGSGSDVVTDFALGTDKLDVKAFATETFATVMSHAVQNGADTVISFADGSQVTLQNVDHTHLTANDFVFATPPASGGDGGTGTWTPNNVMPTIDGVSQTGTTASETFNGTDHNDEFYPKAGNDIVNGGTGNDILHGGDGNDIITGGAGDDQIWGDAGNDTFVFGPGCGHDVVRFEQGADKIDLSGFTGETYASVMSHATEVGTYAVLNFSDGSQVALKDFDVTKLTASDFVFGSSSGGSGSNGGDTTTPPPSGGNTTLPTIDGKTLNGTANADTLSGQDKNDAINGGGGDDRLTGFGGNDVIHGGDGNDKVVGNDGNDFLFGDNGNDLIYGGNGNDVITGGAGNDTLFGEAGADTFVFAKGFGADKINDFQAGTDHIDLSSFAIANQSAFMAGIHNVNGNATIDMGSGDVVTLYHVDAASLHTTDFHF